MYQQMIVIAHQAIGMDLKIKTPVRFSKGIEKGRVAIAITEYGLSRHTTIHHVVPSTGEFQSKGAAHR
nr:hypothetical protein [Microbulbifer sp. TB1203]